MERPPSHLSLIQEKKLQVFLLFGEEFFAVANVLGSTKSVEETTFE